ncbi:MAG TPA: Crp/Fnr family transcriptional regulator [Pyrinomonadaceae bacterium]
MTSASRAVMGSAHSAGTPIRVLPCISPLRSIPGFDRVSRARIYAKGAVVFREGNAALGVYMLSSGRAKISISSADGKKLILRIARGGDILGLYAGLTGRPFEATAEMVEGGRVDFISRQDLLNLIGRQNGPSLNLLEVFSRQFSELVEHTRITALSESALEKLARLLVRWCDEGGQPTAHGIRINLGLTHEELAQMICTSRETVTRLLADLRRKQVVSLSDNAIFIRNRKALELAARG